MKAIQKSPKFKSNVELSEVVKIVLLILLAAVLFYFEYYLNKSEDNVQAQNSIQEREYSNPGILGYNNYEIHF